ncbi:MAG: hypothetical protein Q7K38_00795 [Candidatus Wildermuthbacteria bacterium]|nr:hypothetical protein [Candidatus Wildermuthbacteria bacterium]
MTLSLIIQYDFLDKNEFVRYKVIGQSWYILRRITLSKLVAVALILILVVLAACGEKLAITITSPVEAEVWQAGTAHVVGWESNLAASSEVSILLSRTYPGSSLTYPLRGPDGNYQRLQAKDGYAKVFVPKDIPIGDWTLVVSTGDGSVQARSAHTIKVN